MIVYIFPLIGVFLGMFLGWGFIALFGKKEWRSLRFWAFISLGVAIGIYSVPLLATFFLYPAYFSDVLSEFPVSLHEDAIFCVVILLGIGCMADRNASKKGDTDIQS